MSSVIVGVLLFAVVPLIVSTLLIVFRDSIVRRQKEVALKKFGKAGPTLADGMNATQVVVVAVAFLVLAAINVVGYISTYG